MQSASNTTQSNQTNSTSPPPAPPAATPPAAIDTTPAAAEGKGSILSAWYLWIGILLGVLFLFGVTILLWYLARVNKRKILCFGPSADDLEQQAQ